VTGTGVTSVTVRDVVVPVERLLADHPALLHLRAIETAAERGGTVVLQPPS